MSKRKMWFKAITKPEMGYLPRSKCHHYERWGWEWEGENPSTSLIYYFDMFTVFYSRTFTVSPTPNITASVLSLQVILTALRFSSMETLLTFCCLAILTVAGLHSPTSHIRGGPSRKTVFLQVFYT